NFYSSLKFAHCDMISGCNETSDWAIYTITGLTHTANAEIAVDSNGDLHLAFSRGDGSQADMYYGSCSSASGCDAAEDWTLVNIHDVPASSFAGSTTLSFGLDHNDNPTLFYSFSASPDFHMVHASCKTFASTGCDE